MINKNKLKNIDNQRVDINNNLMDRERENKKEVEMRHRRREEW